MFLGLSVMLAGSYPPLALPDFAIVGGTLWTMETDAPIRGATLLIADGVVEAVATDLEVPAGYQPSMPRGSTSRRG